jgi:hypothetical protein
MSERGKEEEDESQLRFPSTRAKCQNRVKLTFRKRQSCRCRGKRKRKRKKTDSEKGLGLIRSSDLPTPKTRSER